jgi:SAM-dependent methyltransferase
MRVVDRRATLKMLLALCATGFGGRSSAEEKAVASNFKSVYSDPAQRARFLLFLKNVFHLYPERRFDDLIAQLTASYGSDREIYEALQARLHEIKPLFSEVTYALPALATQKQEMARETAELLGPVRSVKGYVEIGTPGRYVKALRKRFAIEGVVFVANDSAPGLSLEDVIERGQLAKAGHYVPLGNYDGLDAGRIPDESVELVTNYIGFHHAPADRLEPFVGSIRRILKPGGRLVVRDHDVDSARMKAMVALAHDVFNAGVKLSWQQNHEQIRNFTSVAQLDDYLGRMGFVRAAGKRLQAGDPTRNTLMLFTKPA